MKNTYTVPEIIIIKSFRKQKENIVLIGSAFDELMLVSSPIKPEKIFFIKKLQHEMKPYAYFF